MYLHSPSEQQTFCDTNGGFPAKWPLRNERRNSMPITHHYPDLGSASDWMKQISTNQKHYPDLGSGPSLVWNFLRSFLRRHFPGKPVAASRNAGCFLRLVPTAENN